MSQNNIKIPVFTVMDEPKYFEVGKDKIETGFFFVESKNYFPTRQNGWYSHSMVNYCLEKKLISMSDIKYKFVSGLELDGDYFNNAIKELMTLPYGLDKAGPNILVGLFNKLKTTTSKAQYFHSFRQASSYLMAHRNGTEKLFIEDIGKNGEKIFKVTSTRTIETDYFKKHYLPSYFGLGSH